MSDSDIPHYNINIQYTYIDGHMKVWKSRLKENDYWMNNVSHCLICKTIYDLLTLTFDLLKIVIVLILTKRDIATIIKVSLSTISM